jgi:3'-5' exoribonuclease
MITLINKGARMLAELKNGQSFDKVLFIESIIKKTANNGNSYLDMLLKDNSASMNAKMWRADGVDLNIIKAGIIATIKGRTEEYNGRAQLIVESITIIEEVDDTMMSQVYAAPPIKPAEMFEQIYAAASKLKNKELQILTCEILKENKERLLIFPGAKQMHHASRGGLLHHIHTMLRAANALTEVYEHLNKDLLYAAVILHDIGKLDEIMLSEYGIPVDYTKEGKLLGHIVQGICIVETKAKELRISDDIILMLKHCLLSHHYFADYGSPKMPLTAEAEILYYLDVMDARMFQISNALSMVEKGEFSQRVYALDNRSMYKFE